MNQFRTTYIRDEQYCCCRIKKKPNYERTYDFLSIPKGMEFKQITEKDNTNDYFVDPNGKLPRINIQALVKDALQYNKGRKKKSPCLISLFIGTNHLIEMNSSFSIIQIIMANTLQKNL